MGTSELWDLFVSFFIFLFLSSFFYLPFFYAFLSRDDDQPTQNQLIQIYSVDWRDVYDTTFNTEQNQLAVKISADN